MCTCCSSYCPFSALPYSSKHPALGKILNKLHAHAQCSPQSIHSPQGLQMRNSPTLMARGSPGPWRGLDLGSQCDCGRLLSIPLKWPSRAGAGMVKGGTLCPPPSLSSSTCPPPHFLLHVLHLSVFQIRMTGCILIARSIVTINNHCQQGG